MRILSLLILVALLGACTESTNDAASGVKIVSSRPGTVTGGDAALVGLPRKILLSVNGETVTVEDRGRLSVVSGLPAGSHEIVGAWDGSEILRLPFTNHPRQGPVISGPHEAPFFCQTHSFEIIPGGPTLGESRAPLCEVETRKDFVGVNAAGDYILVEDPLDAIGLETGVINRAIYQVAIPPEWNGKLAYRFGGGCRGGWYVQGDRTGGVLDEHLLGEGYAVASASLNVFGVNCNDLLAAETMMMVKERFIEEYGLPELTLGIGCSGGSYQALQIGDNYPGLLDGILVGCSFPEVGHAMVTALADARLLKRYFDWAIQEEETGWTEAQRKAVTGYASDAAIETTANGASRIVSVGLEGWNAAEFNEVVPDEAKFHPIDNPVGARPTVFDHTVNVYGRDPETGYARWPFDNRGIQYGLGALEDGAITIDQFLHLNEHVGGFSRNGEFIPERTAHDPEATRAAYESGRILDGGLGLNAIPVIDYRAWSDARDRGDTHLEYHTYSTRERLRAANGDVDNHVVLTEDGLCEGCSLFSFDSPVLSGALSKLDEWVMGVNGDTLPGTAVQKVRRHRPKDLVDACWIDGEKVTELQQFEGGRCNEAFPTYRFPRLVAGGPLANNIVSCTRRPIADSDVVRMIPAQSSRYRQVFSGGVCNWSVTGEAQVRAKTSWWRVPGG
jgi:hypothetical protein